MQCATIKANNAHAVYAEREGKNAPLLCQKKENTLELNFLCIHKSWKLRQPKTEGVRGRELEGHHNNNTQMQTNKYEKNEEEAETHTQSE